MTGCKAKAVMAVMAAKEGQNGKMTECGKMA